MLWDVLIFVFVVVTLGTVFGAVPLSDVLRGRLLLRRSPTQAETPVVLPDAKDADVIPFPSARSDGGEKDEAASQSRRA
jgi:hypothetical protein